MDEQASTPDSLWLVSWFIVNSPWIYAGLASGVVRLVYRWGVDGHPIRTAASEAFLCFAAVSVFSPVASFVGAGDALAMAIGVGVGFVGPDVLRSQLIGRFKAAAKVLLKGGSDDAGR